MKEGALPPDPWLDRHARRLLSSYFRWLKIPLLDSPVRPGEEFWRLYNADAVIVSHGTQADPVFNFASRRALELFETTWDEFTRLPSRMSAEPVEQSERKRLLEAVQRYGYVDDYQGIRVSSKGRRFYIPRATVWNVIDENGVYAGQAAMFRTWRFLK